ncbi:hypothetical protein [Daejeonella lutea]|nr:hypothetical protein [Daejeonella lutea]
MKTLKNIDGLTELDVCEQRKINGGESLWYYLGHAIGKTYRYVADSLGNSCDCSCPASK